ncbi:hypothetical protein AnigIFM50267_010057 [Aspergillus niger]|nr:hypothetical protein AnigIFM50267_010057 [Aspergillus niger]
MDGSIPPPSTTTTTTSTPSTTTIPTSSSSTVFRPRKSEDWNEYRTAIENLYRDNQLKLRDVKRIMERDYNFVASEKQYKDRLAAWHVRKNIKAKEVHVMIRKQQKRAARGKQTGFRVAGQEVDSKRISRFVRRYGSNMEANNAREDPPHSPQGHQIIQPVQPVQPIQATSPEPGRILPIPSLVLGLLMLADRNSLRYELFYPTARGTSNDIITFYRNTVTFP